MAILSHGSDLRLAPSLKPLVAAGDGTVRAALEAIGKAGFEAVQLDATLPGTRPRDLSRRARRDLIALLSRRSVQPAGVDLFIPRRHFVEAEHLDRAMSATLAAIEFAADLGRIPLSIGLPMAELGNDAKAALAEAADGHSVPLAIHAEDQLEKLLAWLNEVDQPTLGAALDPAAVLARGGKPGRTAQTIGSRLRVARLADLTDGAVRTALGEGDLDVAGYRVSLDLLTSRLGPVVLDLRSLDQPLSAAVKARETWQAQAFTL